MEATRKIESGEILKRSAAIRPGHLVIGAILLSLIPTVIAAFVLLSPQKGGEALIRIRLSDVPVTQASPEVTEEGVTAIAQSDRDVEAAAPLVPQRTQDPRVRQAPDGQGVSGGNAARSERVEDEVQTRAVEELSPVSPGRVIRPSTDIRESNSGVSLERPLPQQTVPVRNVAPQQRTEQSPPQAASSREPGSEKESSETDDVREALRDIRPR